MNTIKLLCDLAWVQCRPSCSVTNVVQLQHVTSIDLISLAMQLDPLSLAAKWVWFLAF